MNDQVEIRAVRKDDTDAWGRLRTSLWPDCPAEENAREAQAYFAGGDLKLVLLAFASKNAIGFAEISERNIVDGCDDGPAAYLEGWYVDPDHRHKGIGKALIAAASNWASEQGYNWLGSDVELHNTVSQTAHNALGFEETGRVITYRRSVAQ